MTLRLGDPRGPGLSWGCPTVVFFSSLVWRIGPNETATRAFNEVGHKTARGRFFIGEPVAMRRPAKVPLDRMKFPLTLAGGLRTAFADVVSTPLPRRLAALVRRLKADRDERSGEPNHGASATEPSSRIDRRGRR
jgi:hypothetical protein